MKTIELTDRAAIDDVITRCPYCMLGLTDEEGKPYVVPMNFAWEDGHAYLHSGAEGTKTRLLEQGPVACLTFCDGAELVWMHITDPDEKRRALMLMMRHYTAEPLRMSEAAVRGVRVWRIDAEEITARSFGNRPSEL